MKKFFGVLGLIFCVFLASCNFNNLSGKTGSLEFSIPVNEIIKVYNQNSAREVALDFTDESFEAVYLMQLQGSKKYYKSEMVSKTFTPSDVSNNKINLDFSFDQVPVGQSYTIMFDFFVADDSDEPGKISEKFYMPVFTGKQEGVSITAGKTTNINLSASLIKENSLGVKVDFKDGTSKTYKGVTWFEQDAIDSMDPTSANYEDLFEELHSKMSVSLTKEGDKLFLYDFKTTSPLEVNDVSYVIDSKSNFTDSSFKYKVYYEGTGGSYTSYNLDFKNNTCSIKDFIMKKDSFYAYGVVMEKAGCQIIVPTAMISYWANSQTTPVYDPTLALPRTFTFTYSHEVEYAEDDTRYRYVCVVPLSQILILDGTNPDLGVVGTLANEKTFVMMMNIVNQNCPVASAPSFYYMLQPENYDSIPLSDLYTGNNCIPLPQNYTGDFELSLPMNNLSDADGKTNVMFFFDLENELDSCSILASVMGLVFPKNTLAFAKVQNYAYGEQNPDEKPWIWELKVPLRDSNNQPLDLVSKETVNVVVSGVLPNSGITFTGEIFDTLSIGAYNAISNGNKPIIENVTSLPITFNFINIKIPDTTNPQAHDYYFQCQTAWNEENADDVLIIYNASITASVQQ